MPEPAAVRRGVAGATAGCGPVVLEGLDGGTPLGFLAALGVQRVLADCAASAGETPPGLSWLSAEAWRPVLHGPTAVGAVVDAVWEDADAWKDAPILRFRYVKVEKQGAKAVGGLRAPLGVLRAWLAERRDTGDEASLAYASALMCETATEVVDKPATLEQLAAHGVDAADAPLDRATLPTFFDFTSRNAQFLEQVEAIRGHLSRDAVEAGLTRGESDPAAPRSLDWDPSADVPGAIYTGFSRGFLPVAEWFAFRGLVCLPVTGAGESLATTGCTGRRKDGRFVWPLWQGRAGPEAVRSLLSWPKLDRLDVMQRRALGIVTVLAADMTKKADGYAGMFSPARPV